MCCPCHQRPVCSQYWMRKMGSGTYSWMSQVALLLHLEYPGDAISGFACRSVYPKLQRSEYCTWRPPWAEGYSRRHPGVWSRSYWWWNSKIMSQTCEKCSTIVGRRASSLTQRRYSSHKSRSAKWATSYHQRVSGLIQTSWKLSMKCRLLLTRKVSREYWAW